MIFLALSWRMARMVMILLKQQPCASGGFFPNGAHQQICQRIFSRGETVVQLHFTNSKRRENNCSYTKLTGK